MKSALVGVVGHVDHGKTALVRALTGTETDRLREEKERGVSIVLGFAALRTADCEIDLIDMPGHERFVRAMISGATGIGAVMIVVDAGEGVRQQTIEHVDIAGLIGIRQGVIAVTKCDMVAREQAEAVGLEAQALAERAGIVAPPVMLTSALTGDGLDVLGEALAGLAAESRAETDGGVFYLPADRAFAIPGFGPVVTGTLRGAPLAVGDKVEIMPGGLTAHVRGLQIHGRAARRAEPGRRVAVNLRGVEIGNLQRGLALAPPGSLVASCWVDASLRVLASASAPLRNGTALRMLFGTTEIAVRLRVIGGDAIAPGESGFVQLRSADDITAPSGEPFVLRLDSPARTVAGGRVLDPASQRRPRADVGVLRLLRLLADGDGDAALLAVLKHAGSLGTSVERLARVLSLTPAVAGERAAALGARILADGSAVHPRVWSEASASLLQAAEAHQRDNPLAEGMKRERIAGILTHATAALVDAVLVEHVAEGRLVAASGCYRPAAAAALAGDADALAREVEALFRAAGLGPPDEAEVVGSDRRRREALHYLVRQGIILRAADRVQGRVVFFHRSALDQAKAVLKAELHPQDGFLAREAGAALGISRKYSIPLLEHLDGEKFTRRVGDRRFFVVR